MTSEIAIEYLKRRAAELGHGDNYHIRFRHFVLAPLEQKDVAGATALFLLTSPSAYVRIESETGVFDLTETASNELQYEHQGTIQLVNYSSTIQHVQMIQLIFKSDNNANTDREVRSE